MKHRSLLMSGLILGLALCAAPIPAHAGASFDFLFSMGRVSNDRQIFLNVAVSNYGYDRVELEPVLPRLQYVDADLPVVLFLAHECGRPPGYIVDLRARGLAWSVIFTRVGVRPDVLFYGIDRDPGPPYGHAYGYWRKDPRGVRLSDNDIAGLVQVQIGARAARLAPYEIARGRGRGERVEYMVAEKRGRPYRGDRDRGRDDGRRGGNDDRRGKGGLKEHGHGHGNDHDHGHDHGHEHDHDG